MSIFKFFFQSKPKRDNIFGIGKDRKESVNDLIRSMRNGRNFDK